MDSNPRLLINNEGVVTTPPQTIIDNYKLIWYVIYSYNTRDLFDMSNQIVVINRENIFV